MDVPVRQPHLVAVAQLGDPRVPERVPARGQQRVRALVARGAPHRQHDQPQGADRRVAQEGRGRPAQQRGVGRGHARFKIGHRLDYRPRPPPGRSPGRGQEERTWRTPHAFPRTGERSATCPRGELAYADESPAWVRAGRRHRSSPAVRQGVPTPSVRPTRGIIWEVRTCPGRPRLPYGRAVGRPGAGANRWVVLVVLCVSLLLVAVDATVLHVAVPAVTEDLKPGAVQLLWIVDVYPLVCASLLILFGTLGDRVGRRRVLLLGYGLFRRRLRGGRVRPERRDAHPGPRAARRRRRDDHARDPVDPPPGLPRPARARPRDRRLERGRRGRRRGRTAARRLPAGALLVGARSSWSTSR